MGDYAGRRETQLSRLSRSALLVECDVQLTGFTSGCRRSIEDTFRYGFDAVSRPIAIFRAPSFTHRSYLLCARVLRRGDPDDDGRGSRARSYSRAFRSERAREKPASASRLEGGPLRPSPARGRNARSGTSTSRLHSHRVHEEADFDWRHL